MGGWGKRRGLSPLPSFGRARFDEETRRAFSALKRAEEARELNSELQNAPAHEVSVMEAVGQPRRRQAPASAHLGRILDPVEEPTLAIVEPKRVNKAQRGNRYVVRVLPKGGEVSLYTSSGRGVRTAKSGRFIDKTVTERAQGTSHAHVVNPSEQAERT